MLHRLRPVSLLLMIGLIGCGTVGRSGPRSAPRAPTITLEPNSEAMENTSRCPEVTLAQLEPPEPAEDPRRFQIATLMKRPEAPPVLNAPAVDLGTVPYAAKLPAPRAKRRHRGGIGWRMPPTSWYTSLLPSSDATLLSRWGTLASDRMNAYGLVLHWDERARIMRADPAAKPRALHCAIASSANAAARAKELERELEAETRALIAVLKARPNRSLGEDYLLGFLIADTIGYEDPADEAVRTEARAHFERVSGDPTTPPELAARAEENLARLSSEQPDDMKAHLERVLVLTKDDGRIIDTHIKLLAFMDDPEPREKALRELLVLLDGREELRWRKARMAIELAKLQLARSAYQQARQSALVGATATVALRNGEADTWDAAPPLAETLVELDSSAMDDEIALPFLGPLTLAIIEAARTRGDRELAQQVAERLLRDLPDAPEAPRALSALIALTEDPERRAAMQQRRESAYGEGTTFYQAQRKRLSANYEGAALESELVELLESAPPWRAIPHDPPDLRAELERRASDVARACKRELSKSGATVTLTVDTRDPQAKVSGGTPAVQACLVRAVPSRFRSLPPRQVRVRLAPR